MSRANAPKELPRGAGRAPRPRNGLRRPPREHRPPPASLSRNGHVTPHPSPRPPPRSSSHARWARAQRGGRDARPRFLPRCSRGPTRGASPRSRPHRSASNAPRHPPRASAPQDARASARKARRARRERSTSSLAFPRGAHPPPPPPEEPRAGVRAPGLPAPPSFPRSRACEPRGRTARWTEDELHGSPAMHANTHEIHARASLRRARSVGARAPRPPRPRPRLLRRTGGEGWGGGGAGTAARARDRNVRRTRVRALGPSRVPQRRRNECRRKKRMPSTKRPKGARSHPPGTSTTCGEHSPGEAGPTSRAGPRLAKEAKVRHAPRTLPLRSAEGRGSGEIWAQGAGCCPGQGSEGERGGGAGKRGVGRGRGARSPLARYPAGDRSARGAQTAPRTVYGAREGTANTLCVQRARESGQGPRGRASSSGRLRSTPARGAREPGPPSCSGRRRARAGPCARLGRAVWRPRADLGARRAAGPRCRFLGTAVRPQSGPIARHREGATPDEERRRGLWRRCATPSLP